jgi:hypothetical protein
MCLERGKIIGTALTKAVDTSTQKYQNESGHQAKVWKDLIRLALSVFQLLVFVFTIVPTPETYLAPRRVC